MIDKITSNIQNLIVLSNGYGNDNDDNDDNDDDDDDDDDDGD